jgi:predicted DNA-binding transcriptional regulator AlpA
MTPTTDSPLVTAAQAAQILGVSRSRVMELAATAADFPPSESTSAGSRGWPRSAIEAWAAAHPDRGPHYAGPHIPPVGEYTGNILEILDLAASAARELHHSSADEDHLVLALLHPDCPGAARAVLRSFGISPEPLQRAFILSLGDPFEPRHGWVRAPERTRLLLERANLEAVALADLEVSSEHVLLAMSSDWGASFTTALLRRHGVEAATVRRRVVDLTEGVAIPPPPQPLTIAAEPVDPASAALQLAPTPDGSDPRQRKPWGSRVFVDADGRPVKKAGWALQQYFVDRDGNPVLTNDGQPVHVLLDERGKEILDANGRPLIGVVPIPQGTAIRGNQG